MASKPARRAPRLPKPSLMQRLRTDFLTGLVVVLPMFLTGLPALGDHRPSSTPGSSR